MSKSRFNARTSGRIVDNNYSPSVTVLWTYSVPEAMDLAKTMNKGVKKHNELA